MLVALFTRSVCAWFVFDCFDCFALCLCILRCVCLFIWLFTLFVWLVCLHSLLVALVDWYLVVGVYAAFGVAVCGLVCWRLLT